MERNINDINREPYTFEPYTPPSEGSPKGAPKVSGMASPNHLGSALQKLEPRVFFSDLTKKLVSSAGEKAASAIGAKAGEAIGNKLFGANRQKKKLKSPEGQSKTAPAVEENKGSELVKLLQVENENPRSVRNPEGFLPRSAASRANNIHEIYERLLSDE